MNEVVSNIIDVPDMRVDGNGRHILDSPDKIIWWIKHKFEEQKSNPELLDDDGTPLFRYIDLSNCVINTEYHDAKPALTNLCDILNEKYKAELPNCFIINGYGSKNRIYHEVLVRIECENSLIHGAFFHQTRFHEDVNFVGTEFKGLASFGSCIFDKRANFNNTNFIGNSGFEGCTFNGKALFNNAIFDCWQVHFEYSVFNGEFQAQNIKFLSNDKKDTYITFHSAVFRDEVDLSLINFTRGCNFGGAKFYGGVNFTKSHFTDVTFHSAEINGHILFTAYSDENDHLETVTIQNISFDHSKVSGRIDFEQCKIDKFEGNFAEIKKGAILRIYQTSIKSLDLTSINNDGVIIFEDNEANIEKITLKSSINGGSIEIENTEIKGIEDRKTACRFKDAAFKSGNVIDGLKYKPEEMKLYEKELIKKIKKEWEKLKFVRPFAIRVIITISILILAIWMISVVRQDLHILLGALIALLFLWASFSKLIIKYCPNLKSFVTFCNTIPLWELILLKLNTFSNNNGLSWFRGILFTFFVWFFFYSLFIMCRDGIGNTFFLNIPRYQEEFLKYLWLPNGFDGLFSAKLSLGATSVFILGKIFIGYGIYQTISAFRKYGK